MYLLNFIEVHFTTIIFHLASLIPFSVKNEWNQRTDYRSLHLVENAPKTG